MLLTNSKNIDKFGIGYLVFSRILDSELIQMDLNNNLYYFFIDKNYRLFNLKYSKEVFLDKDILLKIIKQIANKYKILKYELYFKDTSLELNKYFSVVYYYGKTKLSKNLFKSYKSFQNISINSEIGEINEENLFNFYNLYKDFSAIRSFNIQDFSFFKDLIIKYGDNFYILNSKTQNGKLIGSTILLKFEDKIILMYGGYNIDYIKKGLKYYINCFIIDYFEKDYRINEIIFGTGKEDDNLEDSLFKFKYKFGDIYTLNKMEGYLE